MVIEPSKQYYKVAEPDTGKNECFLTLEAYDSIIREITNNVNNLEFFYCPTDKKWEVRETIPVGTPGTLASPIRNMEGFLSIKNNKEIYCEKKSSGYHIYKGWVDATAKITSENVNGQVFRYCVIKSDQIDRYGEHIEAIAIINRSSILCSVANDIRQIHIDGKDWYVIRIENNEPPEAPGVKLLLGSNARSFS